jgi:hypothetical protein
MAQPRNRLPHEENERIILETLRRARLEFGPTTILSGGGGGGGGGGGSGSPVDGSPFVPRIIAAGKTFTVHADTQVLFALPINVLGTLTIEAGGALVAVN